MNIGNTLKGRFDAVQKSLQPDNVSVTLSLKSNAGFEEVAEEFVSAIERLDAYIKNGHSTKGLPFSYGSVASY